MTAPAVLDASAAIHLVMTADHAGSLAERLERAFSVSAPDLFCSEVGNALWKYVKFGAYPSNRPGCTWRRH